MPNQDELNKRLLRAAQSGTAGDIKKAIKDGADIHSEFDEFGNTLLHPAVAFNENSGVIEALIDAGVDVNATNNYMRTPLHDACRSYENIKKVEALLSNEAKIDAVDFEDRTPIFIAAENYNFPAMKVLLERGADIEIVPDNYKPNESRRTAMDMMPPGKFKEFKKFMATESTKGQKEAISKGFLASSPNLSGLLGSEFNDNLQKHLSATDLVNLRQTSSKASPLTIKEREAKQLEKALSEKSDKPKGHSR